MKDRIKELMQIKQLNAKEFASIIGIQATTGSIILSGRNKPRLDVDQKILSSFSNISPDWLISGIGKMFRNSLEKTVNQTIESKNNQFKPQMATLFPEFADNDTEYENKIELKDDSISTNDIDMVAKKKIIEISSNDNLLFYN